MCVRAASLGEDVLDWKGSSPLVLTAAAGCHQPSGSQPPRRNESSLSRVVDRPGTRDHVVTHSLLCFYIIVAPLMSEPSRPRARCAQSSFLASTTLASWPLSCCHCMSIWSREPGLTTQLPFGWLGSWTLGTSLHSFTCHVASVPQDSRQCDV